MPESVITDYTNSNHDGQVVYLVVISYAVDDPTELIGIFSSEALAKLASRNYTAAEIIAVHTDENLWERCIYI